MTDLIPAFAGMSGAAVLDRSRVTGSALTGQTQSRERHHADVRFDFSRFTKASPAQTTALRPARRSAGAPEQARRGTLFLRLGGKLQRIALAAAGIRSARGLGLGDIPGVDGDHAHP